MATIIERETGKGDRRLYVVFWAVERSTRKRRKVWTRVASDKKKDATTRRAEIEIGLRENGGLWPLEEPREPLTVSEYLDNWIESRARHQVTPRVLGNYTDTIRRFLKPEVGHLNLADLRRRHVNDLVAQLAGEGRARNTIRNVLIPLRKALNDAVDDELLAANPAVRIALPETAPVRKARVPSPEHLQQIMASARPDARDVIAVVASLGLRRGEVFALRWEDVDFEAGLVHVHATNHGGQIQERTKTQAGTRLAPLFDSARKVLVARQLRRPPLLSTPDSLVFANAIGGPMDPGNWYRREWARACKAAGLEEIRRREDGTETSRALFHFHDLRHFAATQLDEQGMSGKLRTEIIGHANEEITNSVYTHVRRERVAEAASRFDPLRNAANA